MAKEKKKQSIIPGICLCAIVFLIGIGIILYPILSAQYSESVRSEIRTEYKEALKTLDTDSVDSVRAAAQEFNQKLFSGAINRLDPANNGYFDQLDAVGTGIMGYVSIPKINILLPIYHGTGDAVLQRGAGHMPQSSLPIGGENTHTVITAHTGMATNPMFSDLELLDTGDVFQIEVLDEVLTYEIYNIEVVLPQHIDSIQISRNEDLATLVTCTPIGINSHRLLVHGTRIPTPEEAEVLPVKKDGANDQTDSIWMSQYKASVLIGVGIAAGIILIFVVFVLIRNILRKRKRAHEESDGQ